MIDLTLRKTKEKLVVVGNGMAGGRTLEELLKLAPGKYDVTVFGAEPYGDYNRILLSSVLAGEKGIEEIMLHGPQWYQDHGVTLHSGKEVTVIDRIHRRVEASDGTSVPYDRLLLATGSDPVMLPVPGHDLEGVITFRCIGDVHQMLAAAEAERTRALVIGGGLLGLEAANGLAQRGMQVTVVHLMDTLMERQLDISAARLLQHSLQQRGIDFLLQAQTAEILGDDQVRRVRFKDGREVPTDLVVMAVGIRPNVQLARAAGLYCERGIVVNDTLQTYDPRIYAVGECIQHRGNTYGLVAPLWEQAKVCANHLAAFGIARYLGSIPSTTLKVSGVDLFSAGDFLGSDDSDTIVLEDPEYGVYKKLVIKDNHLRGTVLYGDAQDGPWYNRLMEEKADIGPLREHLIFGQAAVTAQSG